MTPAKKTRHMRIGRTALTSLIVAIASCSLTGCTITPRVPPPTDAGTRAASDVTKGEKIELRLLTFCDPVWTELHIDPGPRPPELKLADKHEEDSGSPRFLTALAATGGALVGAIVDGIQAAIKAEAETHQRQYRQTIYATDFWEGLGQPRYAGFELKRLADGYDDPKPASRFVVAFVYSEHDPRMVLLKPVYLNIRAAKAKVSSGSGGVRRVNVNFNALIVGSYVNEEGALVQQNLADSTFVVGSLDLDDFRPLVTSWTDKGWDGPFKYSTAGFFFAPRPSADVIAALSDDLKRAKSRLETTDLAPRERTKYEAARAKAIEGLREAARGGAFGLTAIVTETDSSKAKDTLIRISDFVGAQRTPLVDQTRSLIDPTKK